MVQIVIKTCPSITLFVKILTIRFLIKGYKYTLFSKWHLHHFKRAKSFKYRSSFTCKHFWKRKNEAKLLILLGNHVSGLKLQSNLIHEGMKNWGKGNITWYLGAD